MLLIFRIKYQEHRRLIVPVPVWVIDVFMDALTDIAWLGEKAIKHLPVPEDKKTAKSLWWVKRISICRIISASHSILKDLTRYKGLDIVDVDTGDVQVKISLK